MPISKFEKMLKTNAVYFFDATEFEEITQHYIDSGRHALAYKSLKLGFEQHPSCIALKLLKVELFIFEHKIDEAVKLLNEVEVLEPSNDEVYIQRASILSKGKKHNEAIAILKEVLLISDNEIDVWSLLAMEYLYLEEYANAAIYFEKCIREDIDDYSSLYNIIYCYEVMELHEKAITFLKWYIDQNPYNEIAWHQLGAQYVILNKFEKALQAFDYAILIDDTFIGGYLEKAKMLEVLHRYQEAIENYIITLKLDDPTSFACYRIAKCFLKLNELDTAVTYAKKAVQEDPLLDNGWYLLAFIDYEKGEFEKALNYINKAIEIDDQNCLYWRKYAETTLELNFYQETITAFKKCISLKDDSIEVYITLSDILVFTGSFDEALIVLIKAKKKYKTSAEIEYRLCGTFMILGNDDFALTHLKNGLSINPDYYNELKILYPTVFEEDKVVAIINDYLKGS